MSRIPHIVAGVAMAAYPILVYILLRTYGIAAVAVLSLALGAVRLVMLALQRMQTGTSSSEILIAQAIAPCLLVLVGGMLLATEDELSVRFYPVVVNLAMLTVFLYSLLHPPTVIERVARIRRPDIPRTATPYLRSVTKVWCLFFVANGLIAFWTATQASLSVWALYNGLIAYVLIGALLAGEVVYRKLAIER